MMATPQQTIIELNQLSLNPRMAHLGASGSLSERASVVLAFDYEHVLNHVSRSLDVQPVNASPANLPLKPSPTRGAEVLVHQSFS